MKIVDALIEIGTVLGIAVASFDQNIVGVVIFGFVYLLIKISNTL